MFLVQMLIHPWQLQWFFYIMIFGIGSAYGFKYLIMDDRETSSNDYPTKDEIDDMLDEE